MNTILEISRQNPDLSLAEAQSLLGFKKYKLVDKNLFLDNNRISIDLVKRLAYTKAAYKVLFESSKKTLLNKVKRYNFNKIIRKSYKIFYEDLGNEKLKKEINDIVWSKLRNPKVNIKNPEQKVFFLNIKSRIYCCIQIYENTEDFDSRSPHKRLGLRPISMQPRLARSLVNLTGCKKGKIYDPMTGTSGILIEGMLCSLNVVGYDINDIYLRISKANFNNLGFKKTQYTLKNQDFFELREKIDFIASDLPYGKNTKDLSTDFYEKFLAKLDKILKKRAIVVFPEVIDVKKLFKKTRVKNIELTKTFNYYIHCSMSRVVCVIEKR